MARRTPELVRNLDPDVHGDAFCITENLKKEIAVLTIVVHDQTAAKQLHLRAKATARFSSFFSNPSQ